MSVVSTIPTATVALGDCDAFTSLREGSLAAVAFSLIFVSSLLYVPADPDLWGHLQFGLTHLETGRLADTDPYSYTAAGRPWVNHEWLTEWLFGWSYSQWGTTGLMLLRGLLLAACVSPMWLLTRRRALPSWLALAWGVFAFLVLTEFFRVRPQMFTFALMALLLWICDRYQAGRWGWTCTIPAWIALWTNLHGGFVAGLGVFGIHWCCWMWDARRLPERRAEWTRLAALMLAAVAATCVNPFGWQYWKFVIFAVTLPRPSVTEWQPVYLQNGAVMGCYLLAVLLPAFFWLRSSRRGQVAETLTFMVGVILAWQHARHFPFLLLFGTVMLARRAPEFLKLRLPSFREVHLNLFRWQLVAILLLCTVAMTAGASRLGHHIALLARSGPLTVSTDFYPVRAVDFLLRNRISGKLDCGFNWGEYCLFKLYPHCTVFCDGRYETVYPETVTRLAMHEANDPSVWRERLDAYETELVLAGLDDPFGDWVSAQDEFAEIYRDDTARILVRRSAYRQSLRRHKRGELEMPSPPGDQVRFPA